MFVLTISRLSLNMGHDGKSVTNFKSVDVKITQVELTKCIDCLIFFSSPEHEVLMVSYCGQWLSVVRRRASCVVRRASTFDVYTLEATFATQF